MLEDFSAGKYKKKQKKKLLLFPEVLNWMKSRGLYYLHFGEMSYNDAVAKCNSLGATLPTFTTEKEFLNVGEKLKLKTGGSESHPHVTNRQRTMPTKMKN